MLVEKVGELGQGEMDGRTHGRTTHGLMRASILLRFYHVIDKKTEWYKGPLGIRETSY